MCKTLTFYRTRGAGPSRASVVIHLFSIFCEELVSLVNSVLTYSTLTVCHFQHFKCFWALNSIFSQNFPIQSKFCFKDWCYFLLWQTMLTHNQTSRLCRYVFSSPLIKKVMALENLQKMEKFTNCKGHILISYLFQLKLLKKSSLANLEIIILFYGFFCRNLEFSLLGKKISILFENNKRQQKSPNNNVRSEWVQPRKME